MFKTRTYIDRKSLINLYNAYIYPYLIYCVESWRTHQSAILIKCIFYTHKMVRLITFSNYNQDFHRPSKCIFRDLQVLPFYNLVQNIITLLMYKIVNGLLPEIMSESCIVNNEVHGHFTRQSHLLHAKKGNIHIPIQSFTNTGPRIPYKTN